MALSKAPCLSLQASGSVAGALSFSRQKRQNIVKGVAVPSGPPSDAQLSQRAAVEAAASYWRTVKSSPSLKQAWHDLRVTAGSRLSDYHYVLKWALSIASQVGSDTIFVAYRLPPDGVLFESRSFTTGELIVDTSAFGVYVGDSPTSLSFWETVYPSTYYFPTSRYTAATGTFYFQVRDASGVPRMPPTSVSIDAYVPDSASVCCPNVPAFTLVAPDLHHSSYTPTYGATGFYCRRYYHYPIGNVPKMSIAYNDFTPPVYWIPVHNAMAGHYDCMTDDTYAYLRQNP